MSDDSSSMRRGPAPEPAAPSETALRGTPPAAQGAARAEGAGFELRIEKIVSGGDGLGRHDGRVVFVPDTIAGETHWVVPVDEKGDFIRARSLRRVSASGSRRIAPCEHQGECGGCALMHIEPGSQLSMKRDILYDALKRIGKFDFDGPCDLVPSPELGYRSRARFHYARGRLGLYRRRSHELAAITTCLQLSPSLNRARSELERWLEHEKSLAPWLVSAELQEATDLEEPDNEKSAGCTASFVVSKVKGRWHGKQGQRTARRLARHLEPLGIHGISVTTDGASRMLAGRRCHVFHRTESFQYRQSIGSFFQSNRFLLRELVTRVLPPAGSRPVQAYELHSGVGLFTLPLSRRVDRVRACDTSSSAIRDARANADAHGIQNIEFTREPSERLLARDVDLSIDWAVLDPPRSGLGKRERESFLARAPLEIRYVSCDAATFSRDAAAFIGHGYRLRRLALLDLFPNTHHFETVAAFDRSD